MTHKMKHSLGVLHIFKSERSLRWKKAWEEEAYIVSFFLITLPSFFYLGPMIPYIRFFKVISILKNFFYFSFFISDCFSAMINTAYLSFLKILSSMTPNPSDFLRTFMIAPSFSLSWVLFPGIFFPLSGLYMLALKDIFSYLFS